MIIITVRYNKIELIELEKIIEKKRVKGMKIN
jgi:hypothetical protein